MTNEPKTVVHSQPLAASALPLLHKWLNEPHLKPFYMQEDMTADEVSTKFKPRLSGDHPCRSLIFNYQGEPFGYLQWYLNRSFPEYGVALLDEPDGVSFDYFIGNTKYLGQGLGPIMLRKAIMTVSPQIALRDQTFFVLHQIENHKAVNCSERAGFSLQRSVEDDGKASALYSRKA